MIIIFILLNSILSNIHIIEPSNLKDEKVIYSVSFFGDLTYNKTYKVKLIIPPKENLYGCKSLPILNKEKNSLDYSWLIKRGKCSFYEKSLNIKASGGNLGIIYLNDPKLSPKKILPSALNHEFENVPTILIISKILGEKLLNNIQLNKTPILKINLEIEKKKKKIIDIEYSINPSIIESYKLLLNFNDEIKKLGKNIKFEPKYRFKKFSNYFKNYNLNYYNKFCLFLGNYCLDDVNYKYSIKEYYNEAVYQKCIYLKTYNTNLNIYWNYIKYYYENCFKITFKSLKECREIKFKSFSKNNKELINKCFEKSFFKPNDYGEENTILLNDKLKNTKKNIYLIPAFFINQKLLKQRYKKEAIIKLICNSFIKQPTFCVEYFKIDIDEIEKKDFLQIIFNNWLYSILFIGGIILIIIFILFIVKLLINRKIKNSLKKEVEDYISDYLKIEKKENQKFDEKNQWGWN